MLQAAPGPMQSLPLLVLMIGAVVVVSILLRAVLDRSYVPSLVGFMALGFLIRLADSRWGVLSSEGEIAFEVLAELGVIALLFRVGLESDLAGLLEQLPHASLIWIGNVVLSAVPGYLVMSWLGFGVIPSLIAATALTATSIGVSVEMWRRHGALRTPKGELLTDVAEMDDLSGIALMALLFSVLPVLRAGGDGGVGPALLATGGLFAAKLVLLAGFCFAFARYGEQRMTRSFLRLGSAPELMVLVAGVGIVIAGLAALLDLSVAIGALLAGLAFSRDPEAVNIDAGFSGLFHLLAPFFFVGIGLALEVEALGPALGAGAALAVVAILGKLVGAGLPALVATGAAGATLIGVSMVPRAEIAMIIMERGQGLGDWAVPPELYAAFVLVSAVTCLIAPVTLELLFRRWPEELGGSGR